MDDGILSGLKEVLFGRTGLRGGNRDSIVQSVGKSTTRQIANQIIRGALDSLLGGCRR